MGVEANILEGMCQSLYISYPTATIRRLLHLVPSPFRVRAIQSVLCSQSICQLIPISDHIPHSDPHPNPLNPDKRKLTIPLHQTANTQIPVLSHSTKKPGCGAEILAHFRTQPELADLQANEIAIVGDRLSTDVMMANMMGSYGLWVKDGVVPMVNKSVVS